jgi:hypothetical protein
MMTSRLLATLHESEAIEELLIASQNAPLALIRRRRSIDLLRVEPASFSVLHTLALTAEQLISLHDNRWLAVCAETGQLALLSVHESRQLRILSRLPLRLPADWPPVGASTVTVCCHSATIEPSLRVNQWLFVVFVRGVAATPQRFSVRVAPDARTLAECQFFAHTGHVAVPVAVLDAVTVRSSDDDGTPCVALLHVPRGETSAAAVSERTLVLSFYEMRDVVAVQQWALGEPLWVAARVSPRLMRVSGATVAVLARGTLHRLSSGGQDSSRPAIDCHGAEPPVAYHCDAGGLLCFVAKSGELGVVVDSEHFAVDCSDSPWPFDPPHSVVATRAASGRVTAVIASRCNVRLVTFDLSAGGAVVRALVDGAVTTRLPIADAALLGRGAADIVLASGGGDNNSVSLLHRVSFGVPLVVESRSDDGDLGFAKLLSVRAFLGSARATVVVVSNPVASTSQAFVLDEAGVPTAHEVAIDEASDTLALVACDTLMAVQATALQVTRDAVNDIGTSGWVPLWQRPSELPRVDVVAQCGAFVALACGATLLLCRLFDVVDDPFQVLSRRTFQHAIAAVALTAACTESRPLVAVSQWTANDVSLLESSELKTVSSAALVLGERATAMCWLEKAAGAGERFGASARLLLAVGCGDGAMHVHPVVGTQLASERLSVSVGVSAVSLLPVSDDDATASVLALCPSGTLTASSAMLLHVRDGAVGVLAVVNADAVRSACTLDATPRTVAWLSASDGALVVGQLMAPANDAKRWSATSLSDDAIAVGVVAGGAFVVVLFDSAVAVFSVAKGFRDPVGTAELTDASAIDMVTLSDDAVVAVRVRQRADRRSSLLLFAISDGSINFVRELSLGQFGVVCRLERSLLCAALAFPPRLLVLNSALSVVGSHTFEDESAEFQFNELLSVGGEFVCALSHGGARLLRVRADALVLNVPLAMASTVRFCECALLEPTTIVAFDYGGGATLYDLKTALAPFRHDEFEVPLVDALPFVRHDDRFGGGDRVLRCWRVDELSVCMQSYLAPHTSQIDSAVEVPLLLLMASGELQLRSFALQ